MKIIGHRGAKGLAPENTIEALNAGIEAGADAVEVDLRLTSDGAIVLYHDPNIEIGEERLIISGSSLEELRKAHPQLATFDEALSAVNRRVPLFIEIKPGVECTPIISRLQKALNEGWVLKDFALLSFDQAILKQFKTTFPGIKLVVNEKWSGVRATWRARQLGTKYIQMDQRWLWWGFVRSLHRAGYALAPYTVNSPSRIKTWSPYLDGVITDYPDRFSRHSEQKHIDDTAAK